MILILDFGSQYTQLIARRIREFNVYCEIHPFRMGLEDIQKLGRAVKGVVFSGGPDSVYEKNAPALKPGVMEYLGNTGIPVLGICYGMQLTAHALRGKVKKGTVHEYGFAEIDVLTDGAALFSGLPKGFSVWMSHGDAVEVLPEGFEVVAKSKNNITASIQNTAKNIYAVQFHPEVKHTQNGTQILHNFVFLVCKESPTWEMGKFIESTIKEVRETVGDEHVLCAMSGGVDSSVVAVLMHEAIGTKLHSFFVDNGLLPYGEKERVKKVFGPMFGKGLEIIDAEKLFLGRLKGVTDPERKRKIIGKTFINVFEMAALKIQKKARHKINYLVQGTLYPDVIESVSVKGPSKTIKTHHNVGGLPKRLSFKLIEPVKFLFKDEVRKLGKELNLPEEILLRHPFPGPGLAVRILGEVTKEKLTLLRLGNRILEEEIKASGLYNKLWQCFGVFVPVKTVGIMGDNRTYEYVFAIRAVESQDAMTADWYKLPYDLLGRISSRIINEVRGLNRVVLDISSKPPATIEWE